MKTTVLIILACLLAGSVFAEKNTFIFIDNTIPQDSLDQIMLNIQEAGNDVAVIDPATLPQYFKKAEINTVGIGLCVRTDSLNVAHWKNLPPAQVETRITKDVRPPDKQKVKVYSQEEGRQLYEAVKAGEEEEYVG